MTSRSHKKDSEAPKPEQPRQHEVTYRRNEKEHSAPQGEKQKKENE